MNVDEAEIKQFSQHAAGFWETDGEFKTLHDINPLRMSFIQQRVDLFDKQVIDVGCGGGLLTEAMAQEGAHVTGLDMTEALIKVAKLHQHETGVKINYQLNTAEAYATEHANEFDVVTCLEMLEHVPDPRSVLNACVQMLKPGGQLFLSTLNRNPKSFAFAIVGAEYLLKLIPKGTHHYKNFIKPAELCAWSRTLGLQVKCLQGLHYNPITKHYRLNDDVSVNYLMHLTKV